MSQIFKSRFRVLSLSAIIHGLFLVYGVYQDSFSALKYTDIDYYVFTDAARFLHRGQSPYQRDTYRYTPLLAWLVYPTAWGGLWFSFGKVLFSVGDVVAGWLIYSILTKHRGMPTERALKYASVWMLNPMVVQISTRGSSEGLLGVIVTLLLWAVLERRIWLAGAVLGFAVHFKIYPFIYAAAIVWWLDDERLGLVKSYSKSPIQSFFNKARITLALSSFFSFMCSNIIMLALYVEPKSLSQAVPLALTNATRRYGFPFLQHSILHHFTRIDHRHNFSPYNTLLYLNSSPAAQSTLHLESLAFIPQLGLSAVLIPLALAKRDLASCMFAQTFAFVAFNKVCTSQYFLWYIVLLPLYLPTSSLMARPRLGIAVLVLWVLGQAAWLQQGYQLEFLGNSTFVLGLWLATLGFFAINIGILGIVIKDGKYF